MKKITIVLEEGIIQDITGIPKGIEVEIVDIDLDAPEDDQARLHTWGDKRHKNTKSVGMAEKFAILRE